MKNNIKTLLVLLSLVSMPLFSDVNAGITVDVNVDVRATMFVETKNTKSPVETSPSFNWVGKIGINYQPNHYSPGSVFNAHDVFYVGSDVSNIYADLAQLKAAGFSFIRSYQTATFAWKDLIIQANTLGMSVVYEANIPSNGGALNIKDAVSELKNVIDAVGVELFQSTVILVFAGHENYNGTNATYLSNAIEGLKTALSNARLSFIPVGTALLSGDLVSPEKISDIQKLINAASKNAPLGYDPYPFQWGVTPADKAGSDSTLKNSIAWNHQQIIKQPFYKDKKPVLIAETGWATEGVTKWTWYFCNSKNVTCDPGLDNTAKYLQAVYQFVNNPDNVSSVMVFEAYDEPAKAAEHPTDTENHYGVFSTNCVLKNANTKLLPNASFDPTANPGCLGYAEGTIFSVLGTQDGATKNQPPFSVSISQKNPTTLRDTSMDIVVANEDRSKPEIQTWPYFLLFDNAKVTITGQTSGAHCSFTARVVSEKITWSEAECSDAEKHPVSCSNQTCYLPGNGF